MIQNRMKIGRAAAAAGLVGVFAGLHASAVLGQDYPTKAIEIVNSFSPGGANDLNVRALETVAQRIVGQPFVQTFKPGGGGITGTTDVAHSTPDGYKLLVVTSGELTAGPNLTKVTYSLDSFAFIARVSVKSYALAVSAKSPWKTYTEFSREAKQMPGKLTIGTTATGGNFLTAQYFLKQSGISLRPVPYGGSGPYLVALLGGHVETAWAPLAAAESHVAAGNMRLLGLSGPSRVPGHPDVPTLTEMGVEMPFVQWVGIVAPRSVPAQRLALLRGAFERITKDAAFNETAKKLGIDVAYLPGDAFENLCARSSIRSKRLSATSGSTRRSDAEPAQRAHVPGHRPVGVLGGGRHVARFAAIPGPWVLPADPRHRDRRARRRPDGGGHRVCARAGQWRRRRVPLPACKDGRRGGARVARVRRAPAPLGFGLATFLLLIVFLALGRMRLGLAALVSVILVAGTLLAAKALNIALPAGSLFP